MLTARPSTLKLTRFHSLALAAPIASHRTPLTGAEMENVRTFKEEGNAFFREGQYGRALDRYNRVLTYAVYMFPEGENEKELKSLTVKTHLNMAACHLRTAAQSESSAGGGGGRGSGGNRGSAIVTGGSLKEVHNHCYQALRLDETSAKAHFRKSQAYRLEHKFQEAAVSLLLVSLFVCLFVCLMVCLSSSPRLLFNSIAHNSPTIDNNNKNNNNNNNRRPSRKRAVLPPATRP